MAIPGLEVRGGGSTRVDYILVDALKIGPHDVASLSHDLHRRLRALAGLGYNDHIPLGWMFHYVPWEPKQGGGETYDAEHMVRSCMTWDDKAIAFATNMQQYFHQEWMHMEGPRRTSEQPAVDKMAEMVWDLESKMLEEAAAQWPRGPKRGGITFSSEDRRDLKWLGILRRKAWDTLMEVKNRHCMRHAMMHKRTIVLSLMKGEGGMRVPKTGGLWRRVDLLDLMFQVWRRWTPWAQCEGKTRGRIRRCVRKWEQDTELAIEAARKAKDMRRVWHLMRELGGTGIRA